MRLDVPDGWREAEGGAALPPLLVEHGDALELLGSDLARRQRWAPLGWVDCPVALDAGRGIAYRYVCEGRARARDFSELRAFDLANGATETIGRLRPNQWVLWLLQWMPSGPGKRGRLFGLVASDETDAAGLAIEHRLFALDLDGGGFRFQPLARDAFAPMAFSEKRREIVFEGAEGVHIVNLRGECRRSWSGRESPRTRGAAWAPDGSARVALGGGGIDLWDLDGGRVERLTRLGQHPVWDGARDRIWYFESGARLAYYDLASGRSAVFAEAAGDRHPETQNIRPARLGRNGRFLASVFSTRRMRGVTGSAGAREYVYEYDHALVAFDLKTRRFWRRDGFRPPLRWLDGVAGGSE